MELKKSDPEPETNINDTYAYLAGCIIAIVFWVWFLMWVFM